MTNELRLRSGLLVVLEGLDRSGKSTQSDRLSVLDWADPKPTFTHMPSGLTQLTKSIYRLTEQTTITSPLARQLLHLACHAENIAAISAARQRGGVFLDRWWWSTVAYGWYAGQLAKSGVTDAAFFGMIDVIWSSQPADLVFLFDKPYELDELNRDDVMHGYATLADKYAEITVAVPSGDQDATTGFLLAELRHRGFLSK